MNFKCAKTNTITMKTHEKFKFWIRVCIAAAFAIVTLYVFLSIIAYIIYYA